MVQIPTSLDDAIAQSQGATLAAIQDGYRRLQVELAIPELKVMPVAQTFLSALEELDESLRVFFPDAGAAALARRDWGEKPYSIRGIGELKAAIQPHESLFLFVEPSSVEVTDVEALCEQIGDRTVIFLNPRLEDIATIGIGYAGRQLRERFLNTFESCYYIRSLEGAALFRCYPSPWQLWLESDNDYEFLTDFPARPSGEQITQALVGDAETGSPETSPVPLQGKTRRSILSGVQQFLNALSK